MSTAVVKSPTRSMDVQWLSARNVIIAGLAIGVVFGQAGNFFKPGAVQTYLYALSSGGLVAGAAVLAVRHSRAGHDLVAAGFGLLAVAEMLIWTGGPGATASFVAGVMFYVPALALICLPATLHWVVRLLALVTIAPWSVFAGVYLASPSSAPPLPFEYAGYLLLSATLIAVIVTVIRTTEA